MTFPIIFIVRYYCFHFSRMYSLDFDTASGIQRTYPYFCHEIVQPSFDDTRISYD